MLEICNVNTLYGKAQALWDVCLGINEAEIVAMIGANGAGKTTLLNTISGLLRPASGSVEFLGRRIDGLPPHSVVELGISHVPEGGCVFPDMTVRENLEMGAYPYHAWKQKEETLEQVYQVFPVLKEREGQLARTLSGGERQMLAIGRGLMSDPKLMLLDEMSLGLAPILVNELYRVLGEIRERGITILFVEQNVRRSLTEADRAYIMEAGRVVLSGNTAQLREEESVKKAYFGA